MKQLFDAVAIAALTALAIEPVLAGGLGTPAPVAGVGIGAIALLGVGYRALRKRIDR